MISDELWDRVIAAIASGLTNQDACAAVGIGKTSFYARLKEDEAFSAKVDKAQVSFKLKHLRNIDQATLNDWKASAWLLERKFKNEFSLRTEVTGADGEDANFTIEIVNPFATSKE